LALQDRILKWTAQQPDFFGTLGDLAASSTPVDSLDVPLTHEDCEHTATTALLRALATQTDRLAELQNHLAELQKYLADVEEARDWWKEAAHGWERVFRSRRFLLRRSRNRSPSSE